ncbi:polyprenyl diphosphate synthase [Micromonospora olivasterospora]|uniref:Isoprenyl transferase n=1 Tax=Micromonospora olivasterospora TaxID=1880 RepID=A0A562IDX1_MICOL|nr:polyprenyl diphosphate synthase [Micromonospora olivasterospora]TWH69207.1 short-chain Z-isoprenyl diphosphate synthase [Micromonospora olivasterospora]
MSEQKPLGRLQGQSFDLPEHVAVILDGNRRWAQRHGLPAVEGYRRGAVQVGNLWDWCEELGIGYVTVWAFSLDNLRRSDEAVRALLEVIATGLRELADQRRWRIRPIGALEALPDRTQELLSEIAADTADIQGVVANVAIAYDGRQEIAQAARALMNEHSSGAVSPGRAVPGPVVDESGLARHLYTAGQPDPDLVIRTSGEQRLSGFMPWQTAYAEYHFVPVCWPDFTRGDFDDALSVYAKRQRRSGL